MADPKLQIMMQRMAARLLDIRLSNGYRTDIGSNVTRGNYALDENDWPGCIIRLDNRTNASESNERGIIAVNAVISAWSKFGSNTAEDVAILMLADVQKAIELIDDKDLGGLLRGNLSWQSDLIIYPENNDSGISIQVEYSLPHVRWFGNPEK